MPASPRGPLLAAVLLAMVASIDLWGAAPARAGIIFRAVCGDVAGQRVDVDPTGESRIETWKRESYADVPGAGAGVLGFVSDDAHVDQIRVTWGKSDQLLPIVYRSDDQISVADIDAYGVWIYTLLFRAGKVLISRQTSDLRFGAVGAMLTADCEFTAE
ncbi:MAG: hypothetical protein ACE5FR_10305 [Rhodospirillales bacterium]